MKHLLRYSLPLAVLAPVLTVNLCAQNPASGYVDFGKFSPPTSGGEFVEVHIRSNLISMAARLVEKLEPDVAELLRGLKLVRVNVIGMDNENRADLEKRIAAIRADLDSKGWERVVTAQKKGEDIGVYLKTRGDEAVEGLVVTVVEAKGDAVLVNIVGDIKPEKVGLLGEKLDIEPLRKVGHALKK